MRWEASLPSGRILALLAAGAAGLMVLTLALLGAGISGGGSLLFTATQDCSNPHGKVGTTAVQPGPSHVASNSIPANYLQLFQQMGQRYGVPWTVLAGIGKVESDDGQSTLPGVHSGSNAFGAAGPMQIGIGGASTNTWGGAPVHPASDVVAGVATDGNGDGLASVYEPADAIAGAARYLLEHGVQSDIPAAIFAYNHLTSYVQAVLGWAGVYARGGFTVTAATQPEQPQCVMPTSPSQVPNQAVATIIAFARAQLGKPYLWGGTGPDAFDCSGLVMMAYRAAGISIPRTSEQQWSWGPRVKPSQVEPGDLAFFVGSDGTPTSPGHVGLVIGNGQMIEAYATGFPIRIASYRDRGPIGFSRPWAHAGVVLTSHTG